MKYDQIIDDMNNGIVRLTEYDFNSIEQASERLNKGDLSMSQHERTAAAIVNGRLDFLNHDDFRRPLIEMGRSWAHATIEIIFDHWDRETTLHADHPGCPTGDQRILRKNLP